MRSRPSFRRFRTIRGQFANAACRDEARSQLVGNPEVTMEQALCSQCAQCSANEAKLANIDIASVVV